MGEEGHLPVYITDIRAFLPNEPVANDRIEEVLGLVGSLPSRTRRIILRSNGIRERYYAISPETGLATHTNAALTAEAVRLLSPYPGFGPADIDCLCCGTATPDQIMPGHGVMVHGELGGGPCEVITTAGICVSGMTAFKYAWMNVALGLSKNSVATGSETASTYIRSTFFGNVENGLHGSAGEGRKPLLPFDTDFLRWMLSDGAGAVSLASVPPSARPALKVEWIEHFSFAHELDTCMYAGAVKDTGGDLRGWRAFPSLDEAARAGAFPIKQNVKLLNEEIVRTAVDRTLPHVIAKRSLSPGDIDWFLPHYSSEFFRDKLHSSMCDFGFSLDQERWFSNLASRGNTGSASIYLMLEELFHSGRIGKGEKILCFIPESGRFSTCYMLLTAV